MQDRLAAGRRDEAGRSAIIAAGNGGRQHIGGSDELIDQVGRSDAAKDNGLRVEQIFDDANGAVEDGRDLLNPSLLALAGRTLAEAVKRQIALEASDIATGTRTPPGHDWNMADLASIAPGAADRHAILHHGAAEADAEVQIIELADTSAFTIEPHAQGCCDCIDGDKGGKVAHFLQPR